MIILSVTYPIRGTLPGGAFTFAAPKEILLLGLGFPTSGFLDGVSGTVLFETLLIFFETKVVPLHVFCQMYGLSLLPAGAERVPS